LPAKGAGFEVLATNPGEIATTGKVQYKKKGRIEAHGVDSSRISVSDLLVVA